VELLDEMVACLEAARLRLMNLNYEGKEYVWTVQPLDGLAKLAGNLGMSVWTNQITNKLLNC
jgi:hypothetical protein